MSNTNTNLQTQTSNALHNAIMEAGGKYRPPMLAPGNYVQWKFRIKRYIDTKPNNELINYCLQNLPYKCKWTEKTVPVAEGIDNDIYFTVDACPNACEMWKAIERLKQGESINVQDLETNLYWEFGKFTSRDGESLESYYSRWIPTGKLFNSCTSKDDSKPTHGSNVDIPNIHESKQTLDLSAADISETSVEVDSKLIRKMMFEQHGSSQRQQKFLQQI
ncbi:hypothetical protein Tco_0671102 [Tanacetum coccineum]